MSHRPCRDSNHGVEKSPLGAGQQVPSEHHGPKLALEQLSSFQGLEVQPMNQRNIFARIAHNASKGLLGYQALPLANHAASAAIVALKSAMRMFTNVIGCLSMAVFHHGRSHSRRRSAPSGVSLTPGTEPIT